jgi:SSS family solute:Na+ symporter
MNLTTLDWWIVGIFLVVLLGLAVYTRRYTRSVSDYLAANRCAGRYLLTMGGGIAVFGAMSIVANFEKFYHAGFAASWWQWLLTPLSVIVAMSGWVAYRFRQTRAMTMAQFFEQRYSRKFRIFTGLLAWFSGVLNYGIAPGIVGRFLMYFCGLPPQFEWLGMTIPTLPMLMGGVLLISLAIALFGGFISVLITDFVQSQCFFFIFLAILGLLLFKFEWNEIIATLKAVPDGHSLINPFDQTAVRDFNMWFFMIFAFKLVYNCMGWQGAQSYNCAAKTAHEARMSRVLGEWRNVIMYLLYLMIPVCAYVLLHSPKYAEVAAEVQNQLQTISSEQLRSQMTVPVAMSKILPAGLMGLFVVSIIGGAIGSDDTVLHSFGSIFIQDAVMPFRKKPFSPKMHLLLLRLSVTFVAGFAFVWSLWFPIKDYIFMYMLLTGTLYLGGSGAAIIGGLYWKRGTTAGAWVAMIVGAVAAISGISLQIVWDKIPACLAIAPKCPVNGAWLAMISYLLSIIAYVWVSQLTCRKPFDLASLLHAGETIRTSKEHITFAQRIRHFLGVNEEFTRGDKIICYSQLGWTFFFFTIFLAGCLVNLFFDISDTIWSGWWRFTVWLSFGVGCFTLIWFFFGGIKDMRDLFRMLNGKQRDAHDDGWVDKEK